MEDFDVCPLCLESLDLTDKAVEYCQCGYQMCLWCWHQIMENASKDNLPGRCPNCRTVYDAERITSQRIDPSQLEEVKRRGKAEKKKGGAAGKNRKDLAAVRVLQRNLVYAVGLALEICQEETLKDVEYFGQFGKVIKISVNKTSPHSVAKNGSGSAYITFKRAEDAYKCISTLDGQLLCGRPVRLCFGTTKYCNAFLKGIVCNNPDCLYLHDIADEELSFTKEEMLTLGPAKFAMAGQTLPGKRFVNGHVAGVPAEANQLAGATSSMPIPIGANIQSTVGNDASPPQPSVLSTSGNIIRGSWASAVAAGPAPQAPPPPPTSVNDMDWPELNSSLTCDADDTKEKPAPLLRESSLTATLSTGTMAEQLARTNAAQNGHANGSGQESQTAKRMTPLISAGKAKALQKQASRSQQNVLIQPAASSEDTNKTDDARPQQENGASTSMPEEPTIIPSQPAEDSHHPSPSQQQAASIRSQLDPADPDTAVSTSLSSSAVPTLQIPSEEHPPSTKATTSPLEMASTPKTEEERTSTLWHTAPKAPAPQLSERSQSLSSTDPIVQPVKAARKGPPPGFERVASAKLMPPPGFAAVAPQQIGQQDNAIVKPKKAGPPGFESVAVQRPSNATGKDAPPASVTPTAFSLNKVQQQSEPILNPDGTEPIVNDIVDSQGKQISAFASASLLAPVTHSIGILGVSDIWSTTAVPPSAASQPDSLPSVGSTGSGSLLPPGPRITAQRTRSRFNFVVSNEPAAPAEVPTQTTISASAVHEPKPFQPSTDTVEASSFFRSLFPNVNVHFGGHAAPPQASAATSLRPEPNHNLNPHALPNSVGMPMPADTTNPNHSRLNPYMMGIGGIGVPVKDYPPQPQHLGSILLQQLHNGGSKQHHPPQHLGMINESMREPVASQPPNHYFDPAIMLAQTAGVPGSFGAPPGHLTNRPGPFVQTPTAHLNPVSQMNYGAYLRPPVGPNGLGNANGNLQTAFGMKYSPQNRLSMTDQYGHLHGHAPPTGSVLLGTGMQDFGHRMDLGATSGIDPAHSNNSTLFGGEDVALHARNMQLLQQQLGTAQQDERMLEGKFREAQERFHNISI